MSFTGILTVVNKFTRSPAYNFQFCRSELAFAIEKYLQCCMSGAQWPTGWRDGRGFEHWPVSLLPSYFPPLGE